MTVEAAPRALRELWRRRARLLASNIATGSREHREIAHAAALIRQDYHDRFLVELLQNANDQALRGGTRDSTVVVVRTERLLAVSNEGQPVTASNLERLSSLADSDKTGMLVGNKGVGFKAVYQITDVPEIYSVADVGAGDILDDFALGFALHQRPFDDSGLVATVEKDIAEFFAENPGLARSLEELGAADPLGAVRREFPNVAGFKFPLSRTRAEFAARLGELRVAGPMRLSMRTLVVLPLRDEIASRDASRALDRLVGTEDGEPAQAELAVLFLSGVSKILVLDRTRDARWVFTRESAEAREGVRETRVRLEQTEGGIHTKRFWLLRRDALRADHPDAASRRDVVSEALATFGLEAWSIDDPLPVTIALPMPDDGGVSPLGASGRFCLGLPTRQATGLPAHVDARFFATISRQGIDFWLPYNALLLDVAAEVHGELLDRLRGSAMIETRRAVTLSLERAPGALAEKLFAPGGVADGEVVLGWGGARFLARSACALPDEWERALLPFVKDALEIVGGVERLPEAGLLAAVPAVLDTLGLSALDATPHPWLAREANASSVVEAAAAPSSERTGLLGRLRAFATGLFRIEGPRGSSVASGWRPRTRGAVAARVSSHAGRHPVRRGGGHRRALARGRDHSTRGRRGGASPRGWTRAHEARGSPRQRGPRPAPAQDRALGERAFSGARRGRRWRARARIVWSSRRVDRLDARRLAQET